MRDAPRSRFLSSAASHRRHKRTLITDFNLICELCVSCDAAGNSCAMRSRCFSSSLNFTATMSFLLERASTRAEQPRLDFDLALTLISCSASTDNSSTAHTLLRGAHALDPSRAPLVRTRLHDDTRVVCIRPAWITQEARSSGTKARGAGHGTIAR